MAGQLPYKGLHDFTVSRTPPQAAIPFGNPASLPAHTEFTGFGFTGTPGTPGAHFNRGWRLITPSGSELTQLFAMFTGSFTMQRESGRFRMLLRPNVFALEQGLKHLRVEFLKAPALVVYENIDLALTRTLMAALPATYPAIADKALEHANAQRRPPYADWTSFLLDFFLDTGSGDESPFPVTAIAGTQISSMAASPTDAPRREATIILKSRGMPSAADGVWLNPSFYVRGWPEFFADMRGSSSATHVLLPNLMEVTWAPESNHVFRYVRQTGVGTGDFTDPTQPSATIRAAIRAAQPHDTIVILDTETYREDEIIINKPVTVTSLVSLSATNESTQETDFPMLDGQDRHRVIRIDIEDGADFAGLVCLRSLAIKNGRIRDLGDDAQKGYFGGGGVLVNRHSQTLIENCFITRNNTENVSRAVIPVEEILNRRVTEPRKTLLRAILNAMSAGLGASDPWHMPDYSHLAQSFGGGVSVVYSSPYILLNRFSENASSGGRGGGIGVALYSWPCIQKNRLERNRAGAPNRRDGGAIACCVALPDGHGPTLTSSGLFDDLFDYIDTSLSAADLLAVSVPTDPSPDERSKAIRDSVYPLVKRFIHDRLSHWWTPSNLRSARANNIFIISNEILDNTARDDGGGVYLSILSQAYLVGNRLANNHAELGAGGAIRATMASSIVLYHNVIENNISQSDIAHIVGDAESGGGGIATRNVELEIHGGQIAHNTATGFAGGGVFFSSSDDGGVGFKELPIFHAITVEAFGFRDAKLVIDEDARITNNDASRVSGRGNHGKGGGIYAFRYDVLETPTLRISVSAYGSVVISNRGSVSNADNFALQDDQEHVTIDDASVHSHVTSSTLEYLSSAFRSP